MTRPASVRYLGVPDGASPRRLLGLPEGPLDVAMIDEALARQRARVLRHPAADDRSAKRLLTDLEHSAGALRKHVEESSEVEARRPRRPHRRPGAIELTEFDREVLSTLVGFGGWNHESRARLLSLAARHGIGGQGLQKVLLGLAGALKSGRIRPQDSPRSAVAAMAPLTRAAPSRLTLAIEQLDEALAREVAGDTPGRLLRLVLVFVGVAMVGAYFLVVALSPSKAPPKPVVAPPSPAEVARTAEPPEVPAVPLERPGVVTPVRWPSPPALRGAEPPAEAREALREVANGSTELAQLARRMQLESNRPSDAIYQLWGHLQDSYARSWPLLDPVSRVAAIEGSAAVLRPVQTDEVAARLLEAWTVDPIVLDGPLGPWIGAWSAGMLGEVAARPSSPDSVAAQAIDRLEVVVPRRALLKGRGTSVFEGAAGAWLDRAATTLSTPSPDEQAFADRWQRWFEGQSAVRRGATLEGAHIDAMGEVLSGSLPIAEEGVGSDLLGTLVDGVDWTERSSDQRRARDAMTVWFTDGRIGASRLWALTSLLDMSYEAAWFIPEFVCDPSADLEARARLLERIMAAWPMPTGITATGGGIIVDSRLVERWRAVVERVDAMHASTPIDSLNAALLFSRLNMVAQAFAAGDNDIAQAELVDIEAELAAPRDRRGLGIAVIGRPSGIDGEFASEYAQAGRDQKRREDALRGLRARPAAGDLGPVDAEVLVEEALRGSPAEIRALAQDLIADRFADGPTVLQELLDQLTTAATPDPTVTMLEQVAGERFDDVRGAELMRRVRLALIRKLLEFEPSDARAIDSLSRDYAASLVERSRLFRIAFEEPPPEPTAEDMAERLADQWRVKAGSIFLADPFPAPLDELDRRRTVRRRLVEGAVQACAAEQASLLELMAAVAVADKPTLRAHMAIILDECADRRARSGSAIEQVLEIERAITRVYDIWFEPADTPPSAPAAEGGVT